MKIIAIILALILILPLAIAGLIEIEVKMKLTGKATVISIERFNNVVKLNLEFYNTGSVPYKARARLDILNESNLIFSGWSSEKELMPGERKNFEIYWISSSEAKNLTARIRVYFGNEILEENRSFSIDYVRSSEDIFKIKNFRTYDSYIRFEIKANKTLENVLVVPSDYVHGWIFEQAKINLTANKNTELKIPYIPTVWREGSVRINVFTEDGKYYSSQTFELKKEKGLIKYFYMLYDKLSLFFNL